MINKYQDVQGGGWPTYTAGFIQFLNILAHWALMQWVQEFNLKATPVDDLGAAELFGQKLGRCLALSPALDTDLDIITSIQLFKYPSGSIVVLYCLMFLFSCLTLTMMIPLYHSNCSMCFLQAALGHAPTQEVFTISMSMSWLLARSTFCPFKWWPLGCC